MAVDVSTGSTTIPYGTTLRIGYREYPSTGAYTYINYFPGWDELPYIFQVPSDGTWEIEYTTICPSCSMPEYSLAQTIIAGVASPP